MKDDSKFWLLFFLICGLTINGAIYVSAAYWKDHNAKIVQLIEKGVNPVEAMCAMQDDYGTHPVCLVIAAKMQ